jgi:hypothetical protein
MPDRDPPTDRRKNPARKNDRRKSDAAAPETSDSPKDLKDGRDKPK